MVTWKDLYVETRRRQDEIDHVQLYNAIKQVVGVPLRERFYHRWLAALGALLENWGHTLQTRYTTLTAIRPGSYQIEEQPCSPGCQPL